MKKSNKLLVTIMTLIVMTIGILPSKTVFAATTLTSKNYINYVKFNPDTRAIEFSGWALAPGGIKKVEATVDGKTYTLDKVQRFDLYKKYHQYGDKTAGFKKSIPVSDLGGTANVTLKIIENKGNVKTLKYSIPYTGYIPPTDSHAASGNWVLSRQLSTELGYLDFTKKLDQFLANASFVVATGYKQPQEVIDMVNEDLNGNLKSDSSYLGLKEMTGIYFECKMLPKDTSYDTIKATVKTINTVFPKNGGTYTKQSTLITYSGNQIKLVRVAMYLK